MKKIRFKQNWDLKTLTLLNCLVAILMFSERLVFLNYLGTYNDVELESGFIVPTIYMINSLTFNTLMMIAISILTAVCLYTKNKGYLLLGSILTSLLSISIMITSIYKYVQNPSKPLWNLILMLILVAFWNAISYIIYAKRRHKII